MEFIIGYLLFFFACYVSFYLPGKLMLSRVYKTLTPTQLSLLSWPVGLSIFLLGIYLFSWIHMPYLYLLVLIGVVFYGFMRNRSLFLITVGKIDIWAFGLILLGSLTFLSLTAFSYLQTKTGIQFIGSINIIDGLLHIAYTKNLLTTFPPSHAGLAGIPLRGYHYFYDLLMSRFVLFYHFQPQDLYYRYLPFFISLLYGGGFYMLSSKITKNKISQRLVLFFVYFAQSFAFVLSFFIPSIPPTAELGSIYPLELILNPAIILSIGMLLYFVYLLLETKPRFAQTIVIGFLFGMITELKVYTGIIGISVLAIILFCRIIKKRQDVLPYLLGLLTTAFIVVITYIPNNFGAGSLWFSPFFAYTFFMQEPPFTTWQWELQRIIFQDHHNIPRLFFLYTEAIGLLWILSLGSRIVLFLGVFKIFKFSFWKQEKHIAVISLILIPVLIGSLFVQSISIFDTKQFFWIAGSFIALPAGIALGNSLQGKLWFLQITVISIVVLTSWGGVFGQLHSFVFAPEKYIVSTSDLSFFQKVSVFLPKKAFLVYLPTDANSIVTDGPFTLSPVIAAFTGHATYFESESAQFDIKPIYAERKANLFSLQNAIDDCSAKGIKQILSKIGSSYVLVVQKESCLVTLSKRTIYGKSGLTLYEIK